MLRMSASWLAGALNNIGFCEGALEAGSNIGQPTADATATSIRQMRDHFATAGLPATVSACSIAVRSWEQAISKDRLRILLQGITVSLAAETKSLILILGSTEGIQYYNISKSPFGQHVFTSFPDAQGDLTESALCLSYERYSAAVFHLMRAMERAVLEISRRLTGVKSQKVWGMLLSDIGQAIDAMPRGTEKTDWIHTHTLLFGVKEAWRNDIMHPRTEYSKQEAAEVFSACGAFFRHIAKMLYLEAPDADAAVARQ